MTNLPKQDGSTSHVAASDYRQAWQDKTTTAFADALADDVVLEALLLNLPLKGRDSDATALAEGWLRRAGYTRRSFSRTKRPPDHVNISNGK
jgi:hypothetical protein